MNDRKVREVNKSQTYISQRISKILWYGECALLLGKLRVECGDVGEN